MCLGRVPGSLSLDGVAERADEAVDVAEGFPHAVFVGVGGKGAASLMVLGVDALFGELPGVRLHCGRCCLSRKVQAVDDEGNGSCRDLGGA